MAAQLSIYIGYVHYSVLGATLVGLAFVLPSCLMVIGIGYAYLSYGGLPWILFFFHAEDGILDIGVTGVQTCALPISRGQRGERRRQRPEAPRRRRGEGDPA